MASRTCRRLTAWSRVDAITGEGRWAVAADGSTVHRPWLVGWCTPGRSDGPARVFDALTGAEQPVTMSGRGGMAVGDGVAVMQGTSALLEGVDLVTGWVRWTAGTTVDTGAVLAVAPIVAGATAYAGATDRSGTLIAVDVLSGAERWRYEAGSGLLLTQPAVVDGVVYVGAGSTLLALAAPDALPLATRRAGAVRLAGPASTPGPTAAAGRGGRPDAGWRSWPVGQPARSGAADRARRAVALRRRTATCAGARSSSTGSCTWSTMPGTVTAIDAATGAEAWRFEMGSAPAGPTTPVVAGGVVYALDGVTLHALDASTGAELWNLGIGSSGGSPALAGSHLLVSGPTSLIAVDVGGARGFVDWTFTEPGLHRREQPLPGCGRR